MNECEDSRTAAAATAWPRDLTEAIRGRIDEVIERLLEEELATRLGAGRHERTESRGGYRNGHQTRTVTTAVGPREMKIPRGRLQKADGSTEEWQSGILPRYQRRCSKVDEAILGCYLAGANTRRIRRALRPVLGESNLSKSAVSRVVSRLRTYFEEWKQRDLSEEEYAVIYFDATMVPVRVGRRVTKVPVQVALGVQNDGKKVVLDLQIVGSESTASWKSMVEDLSGRGLAAPALTVVDGNAGLTRAIREVWPGTKIQRCTWHKRENLLAKAPKHLHGELKRDYGSIVYAEDLVAAKAAYEAFRLKWRSLAPGVVKSLEEAGYDLLTFMSFPSSMWKSLRTTNQIERVNEEFKRRTKTQGSFRNETSALVLLYGLLAMGQVKMRKIDGWKEIPKVLAGLRKAG